MDSQRWREIRTLFDELVELDGARQAERLATIGTSDPALRDDVARLIEADRRPNERLGIVEAMFLGPPPELHAPLPLQDPLGLTGRTFAHFRIDELLGSGGMGVVNRAEDTRLGRAVALKVPLAERAMDESSKQRFLHEARSASRAGPSEPVHHL